MTAAQNWQIQLNNAEAALNGMERELSANERAIESLSRQETEAALGKGACHVVTIRPAFS